MAGYFTESNYENAVLQLLNEELEMCIRDSFWRVGRGIAKKLEQNGMFTMGDVALCSERNEDCLLYTSRCV